MDNSKINVLVTNNQQNADNYGLKVAKQRQEQMAVNMINSDSLFVNSNGNKAAISGGIGGAGLVGALAAGIASGPIGLVLAIAGAGIAGITGCGIFANKGANASSRLNQDLRFYELASNEKYMDIDLGLFGNKIKEFGINNGEIPSDSKREEYAQMLKGGKEYRTIAIYEPSGNEGSADYTQLHDIQIDSSQFTSRAKNTGIDEATEYDGYKEDVITTDREYSSVLTTFASSFDYQLNDNGMDKLVNIASALSTNLDFSDDAEFFDINGDQLLNYADLYSLKSEADESVKKEFETIKNMDWEDSKTFLKTLNMTMAQALEKFDFNADGNIDNEDRKIILNSSDNASKDINGDGIIDNKDAEILTSYLQANITRLDRLNKETNALENAIGGENCITLLKSALGISG